MFFTILKKIKDAIVHLENSQNEPNDYHASLTPKGSLYSGQVSFKQIQVGFFPNG
ncbi:hypothetical protein [Fluviispira vulneris]|uniref:hypothetical protein n=1 Tax=Fluviispira vulneris TaxID=2763012 RepID=UPI001646FAEF|nr:hypothetical protein [Fluviispira vulneris]